MTRYPVPTLDEQHRRLLSVRGAIMPDADTTPGGTFWRDDRVSAAAITDVHAHVAAVERDNSPLTAEGAALEGWGALRAVPRKGATTSQRARALEVRGTAGALVPLEAVLTERNTGLRIKTTSAEILGADGRGLVDVQSLDTGERVNFAAGAVFSFLVPPSGVNQQAKLVLDLRGGVDAEREGAYRGRIVNRWQRPPQGGNDNDYTQWALDVAGVDQAFALPERAGVGSVDVVVLRNGRGADRLLTAAERAAVLQYIEARMPIGASARVLEVTTTSVDVEVLVTPLAEPRYSFDWDDAGVGLQVLTYSASTRLVTISGTLPDSFRAGVRLVLDRPGLGGQVLLAQAVTAANAFLLALPDEELPFTPALGDTIYAAGPMTEPIRRAILDGYTVGDGSTMPGIDALGPANEGSRYGAWIDTVERSRVQAAGLSVPGVYRVSVPTMRRGGVVVPDDVLKPDDPAVPGALPEETTTIGILVSGQVLVRSAA